jgi:catechol 2,3-dioxygenase-like lactoylglutathione lyase family enzyme
LKVQLAAVWHFSFAVSDPAKSAHFWTENFDLQVMFRSDEAFALTNEALIIGFFKGTPHPDTMDHMSFRLDSMRALREALQTLKNNGVKLGRSGQRDRPDSAGLPAHGPVVSRSGRISLGALGQNGARER